MGYLQVVFAAIWGVLFFAEHPSPWTVGGAALILVSTIVLAGSGRQPVAQQVAMEDA